MADRGKVEEGRQEVIRIKQRLPVCRAWQLLTGGRELPLIAYRGLVSRAAEKQQTKGTIATAGAHRWRLARRTDSTARKLLVSCDFDISTLETFRGGGQSADCIWGNSHCQIAYFDRRVAIASDRI